MSQHQTPAEYIQSLRDAIKPGTKGAPARRALATRIEQAHHVHANNLLGPKYGVYYHRRSTAPRHGASNPNFERTGRLDKMHTRLIARIANAPAEYLIRVKKILNLRYPQGLSDYLSLYPSAKKDFRLSADGSIYQYAESTEWEKYGSRSYPRTVDRRIEAINRIGRSTVRMLTTGERAETALNELLPDRAAQKREQAKRDADERRKAAEAPIRVYKRVARAEDGRLISIYDGRTEYPIGQTVTDKLSRGPDEAICTLGGIFVHLDPHKAQVQEYPDESRAADLPRVTLMGTAWGRRREYGKIATENFRPDAIL